MILLAASNPAVAAAPARGGGTFTTAQLFDKAVHQSFETQIEFQRVAQAKAKANLAALNLLPELSINSIAIAAAPPMSFVDILKVAGDLGPFLLPSKWAEKDEQGHYRDAEQFAFVSQRADSGQIAQSISYALLANGEDAQILSENAATITAIRDQIKEREKTGIFQIGTSDDVTAVLNAIDISVSDLTDLTENGYVSLSESVGFIDPHGITALVESDEPVSVENPMPLDEDALRRTAIARSPELKQMDALILAAQSEQTVRTFEWLDPKGDPTGGLGFGLPTFVKIAKIQENEIRAERRQVESIVGEKVSEVVDDLNKAASDYQLALQGKLIQERRIARITNNINLGINFELADLVTALQGHVQSEILMDQQKYLYLASWGRLSRLEFTGPYATIPNNRSCRDGEFLSAPPNGSRSFRGLGVS